MRPVDDNTIQYTSAIKSAIIHFIDKYNAHIPFFRQVSGKDEPDDVMANNIYKELSDYYKKNVYIHTQNFTPQQLKFLYSRMKLFIGTRLHSTIFALGAETPSIF